MELAAWYVLPIKRWLRAYTANNLRDHDVSVIHRLRNTEPY